MIKFLKNVSCLALIFTALVSCTETFNSIKPTQGLNVATNATSPSKALRSTSMLSAGSSSVVTDASGTMHVKYFWNSVYGQHNTLSVPVDPNYVIVGGGAVAFYGAGTGGLLWESRPDFANNSWVGSSKDHLLADAHYLWVVATGLRIDGISAAQLKSYITVSTATSSVASHPTATATVPAGYVLLGGGASDNFGSGAGNLLVSSVPYFEFLPHRWIATGKDHGVSSPASITAYAICIQNPIPNFGSISNATTTSYDNVSLGIDIVGAKVPGGYLATCPGAEITYNNLGRMLSGLVCGPGVSLDQTGNGSGSYIYDDIEWTNHDLFATSKDQKWYDGGSLAGVAIYVQKQ